MIIINRNKLILLFLAIPTLFLASYVYSNPIIRTINVKAVGDEEFRKESDWVERISKSINLASAFFEEGFGIKFNLCKVGEWDSSKKNKDFKSLFCELKNEVEKFDNDIVIGFSSQVPNILKCILMGDLIGLTSPFTDYVLVRAFKGRRGSTKTARVLMHELGHVFGAFHVNDSSSLMNAKYSKKVSLDSYSKEIIESCKYIDFNIGIKSLPKANINNIIAIYKKSLSTDVDDIYKRLAIGIIYDELGMLDKSIAEFENARKIDRKGLGLPARLGIVYEKKGMLDKAVKEFKKAAKLNSKDESAYLNIGLIMDKKGMLDEAVTYLRKAIKINDNNPELHCVLAGIYIQKGLLDEAIGECRKAIELRQDYSDAYYNLGLAYHNKLMHNQAIREYNSALAIDENNIYARNNLGIAYYEMGLLNKAESEYLKILERNPDNEMVLNNLEAIFITKKEGLNCKTVEND